MRVNDYRARCQQAGAILRNFGELIINLKISFWGRFETTACDTFIFKLMVKYCSGVEILELRYCNALQLDDTVDVKTFFRNMKELTLCESYAVDGSILSDAKKLTRLTLNEYYSKHAAKFLLNNYPELQTLSIDIHLIEKCGIDITEFLKRHPQLTGLELTGGVYDLTSIGEYGRNLRKLTIWDCQDCNFSAVAQLNKLTSLKLTNQFSSQSIIRFLQISQSFQSLEEIAISEYLDSAKQLIAALPRLINLKRLSISFCRDEDTDGDDDTVNDDLLSDIHRLTGLHALSIEANGRSLTITTDGFVNLVQNLPHLERLSIITQSRTKYMQLKEATFFQVCEIYRNRNQKLVIRNYDETCDHYKYSSNKIVEPFAEVKETVRFMAASSLWNPEPEQQPFII